MIFAYKFHPRGLVIGPNGLLYVANFPDLVTRMGGQVLVFDPETLDFIGAFIADPGGTGSLIDQRASFLDLMAIYTSPAFAQIPRRI